MVLRTKCTKCFYYDTCPFRNRCVAAHSQDFNASRMHFLFVSTLVGVYLLFFVSVRLGSSLSDSVADKDAAKYAVIPPEVSGINEYNELGLTHLMVAAKTGQLESLKNYIAGGADINMVTADNNTALMLAIAGGFYYTSIELIHAKSDPNHRNNNGMTPLLLATVGGHVDIAIGLIDGGADPNISNNEGSTALMMAAQSGSLTIVKSLVHKGAVLDAVPNGGDTALMFAAAMGHADIVSFLLEKGADYEITNKRGYSPLIFAALRGHSKVIYAIVHHDRKTLLARDKLGRSALDHAIASNKQAAVEALVELGAELPRSGYRASAEAMEKRRIYLESLNKPVSKVWAQRDAEL